MIIIIRKIKNNRKKKEYETKKEDIKTKHKQNERLTSLKQKKKVKDLAAQQPR